MNKLILIVFLFFLLPLNSKAQTPKIAFIEWDSIRNQVNLYKTNEIEIARFKAFIQAIDSIKVIKFQENYQKLVAKIEASSCSYVPQIIDKLKDDFKIEQKKLELFEQLMPKMTNEFETKSKEWVEDFLTLKIRYYVDSQVVNGINSNKKIIEIINKEENAKETQRFFLNFLINKIKFDYNLE